MSNIIEMLEINMEKDKSMNARLAMKQYQNNHIQGSAESASPHRLVQMLMEGALDKMLAAKRFLADGNIEQKGRQISWAISIIDGLRACINKDQGGDVAMELSSLYDYMERRLFEANLKNDSTMVDEVAQLMMQLKSGWDGIPVVHHNTSSAE